MRFHIPVARARRYMMATVVMVALLCSAGTSAWAEVGFGFKGGILMPDQDPFKDEYDADMLLGGVLEFDSNLGVTVESSLEYFSQDGSHNGKITIFPFIVSAKYNFFPRYRTTPFVGIGVGTYFFDQDYWDANINQLRSSSKTQFGVRASAGLRMLEDRRVNIVIEAARNFVDFRDMNASSFQVTGSVIFDFYPSIIGMSQ